MLFYFFERIIINKVFSNYKYWSRLAKIVANIHIIKYIYEDTTKWINTHSIISNRTSVFLSSSLHTETYFSMLMRDEMSGVSHL